ncbi:MAG TPA: sugar transferase [Candidatus Peribacteraceae bacterium]|nr:sugar transferase [Candidatus Peribacteraceae bacterium]
MKRSEALFGLLRIPMDALAATAALLLAHRLRLERIDLIPNVQLLEPATSLPPMDIYLQEFVWPSLGFIIFLSAILGLYAIRSSRGAWQEVGRVVLVAVFWVIAVMAWYFLVRKELFYSRILLAHGAGFLVIFMSLGRAAVLLLERALMRHGVGVYRVVSIGAQSVTAEAGAALNRDRRFHYVGHRLSLEELQDLLVTKTIDIVLQTDPSPESGQTIALIDYCRAAHIGYAFFPPVLADVPHLLQVDHLGLIPIIRLQPTPLDGWGRVVKRLLDIVLSAALLIVLSPLLLIIAAVILITSGWPILYVSRRMGERAQSQIPVLKFRSMIRDADAQKSHLQQQNERNDGPLFKITNDPRITAVGQFLRRFDLDELPQLINVFLGHMSLVGPRPHLPEEVQKYKPYERRVFAVKPGITGLAQVSGRSTLNFSEEVRFDLHYVEDWSFWLDFWIMWRTLWVVLSGKGM